MRILGAAVATAIVLAGCPSYDARVVVPESTKEVNKVAAAGKPTPVDILFVVDNSGSMEDEQEKLATNFRAFIEVLASNPDNDYRLAVVTTDAGADSDNPNDPELLGRVTPTYGAGPYFPNTGQPRMCMPSPDIQHGCFRGPAGMRIIDSTGATAEQQIQQFADAVRVGTCGSGTEQGLLGMRLAVTKACNGNFIRPNANLVIVLVSDEDDSSPNDNYVDELLRATGKSISQLRVAAIVGSIDGRADWCAKGGGASCGASVCALGRPSDPNVRGLWDAIPDACKWCSYFNAPDCCPAQPGGGYVRFANEVEERVRQADDSIEDVDCNGADGQRVACIIDSICQDDFSDTLRRIARDLIITNEYKLEPAAKYPPGVVVEINGTRLVNCQAIPTPTPCDFTVTADGATVRITNNGPGENDVVEIYFIVNE